MIKNKTARFFFDLFVIFFLTVIFVFSLLNIFTSKLLSISSFDFFAKFFEKNQSFDQKKLGHQIGEKNDNLSTDKETVYQASIQDFKNNGQNYLTLGPGIFLLPGEYNIVFKLAGSDFSPNFEVSIVDVFRLNRGIIAERRIKSEELSPELKPYSFDFDTTGGDKFELRVYYQGQGKLEAGGINLRRKKIDYNIIFDRASNYLKDLKFF